MFEIVEHRIELDRVIRAVGRPDTTLPLLVQPDHQLTVREPHPVPVHHVVGPERDMVVADEA